MTDGLNTWKEIRWFGNSGNISTPPPPRTPPTIDQAVEDSIKDDELRKRKGRMATMVTGPLGISETPLVATKTLLGA
jgi:hypothetical protein